MLQLIKVLKVEDLDVKNLIQESKAEGYNFVQKLHDEYVNKANDFSRENEILLLAVNEYGIVLGVGGVNDNPYGPWGRLRHVYVSPGYRRMGVGKTLVEALLAFSKEHYDLIYLKTADDASDAFYENLGFIKEMDQQSSHYLRF